MLSKKLIRKIDEAIEKDQGTAYRKALKKYLPLIKDAYRASSSSLYREHLGVSQIGAPCTRSVWYTFRWATTQVHSGRLLRLFNRGHLEEARFLAMLEAAGITVWLGPEKGGQFRLSYFGGHFGTSLDGVCTNIPDLPNTPMLLEFKTSNNKNFIKLTKEGLRISKETHYIQCQVGMAEYALPYTLYMVVNKDTDELYAEITPFDEKTALETFSIAESIIFDKENIPRKLSNSPAWFECKMCPHIKICHFKHLPEKTCRSCENSSAEKNGCWNCSFYAKKLSKEAQLKGCKNYSLNPLFHFPL